MGRQLKKTEVIRFCEQMSLIFEAGLSAYEGVDLMMEDQMEEEDLFFRVLKDIKNNLAETGLFTEALKETGVFPEYVISMTELGERTGKLDEVMKGLAKYYQREEDLLLDIKNACSYPLLIFSMMLVILFILVTKVVPVFNQVYQQMGSSMEGPAAVVLSISNAIRRFRYFYIGIFGFVVLAVVWLFTTDTGLKGMSAMVAKLLRGNKFLKKTGASRFALAMSMVLKSGLDYGTAFDMVRKIMDDNPEMLKRIAVCREMILEEGKTFAESTAQSGIFSGVNVRVLKIAEAVGNSDETLETIAERLDEEVSISIQNISSKIEPTIVVVISIFVGVILLSVMFPLMGILSGLN